MCSAEIRPRDRLLKHGPDAVTDAELLAVLLRNGSPGLPALDVAERLLGAAGGLSGLLTADRRSLRLSGAADGRAAIVLAAAEMVRRVARRPVTLRDLLNAPDVVARHVAVKHYVADQEILGSLYLDVRHRLISECVVFRGTLTSARVEPRQILADALRLHAASVTLFHTHPSGDPSPSPEDRDFCQRIGDAGALLGVKLIDFIIVGDAGRWVSLRQRGW